MTISFSFKKYGSKFSVISLHHLDSSPNLSILSETFIPRTRRTPSPSSLNLSLSKGKPTEISAISPNLYLVNSIIYFLKPSLKLIPIRYAQGRLAITPCNDNLSFTNLSREELFQNVFFYIPVLCNLSMFHEWETGIHEPFFRLHANPTVPGVFRTRVFLLLIFPFLLFFFQSFLRTLAVFSLYPLKL